MIEKLRIHLLRSAGRFADDSEEGGDDAGDGGNDDAGDDDGGGTEGGEGGGDSQGPVPYSRFATVVGERENARREAAREKKRADRLKQQLESAGGEEEAKSLRTEIERLQGQVDAVNDEFTALLEAELDRLPEASRALVNDLPGDPKAKYSYLVKHRTRLAGSAPAEGPEEEEEKRPKGGPKHEKKPEGGGKPGPSSRAKAFVDRRKGQTTGWGQVAG